MGRELMQHPVVRKKTVSIAFVVAWATHQTIDARLQSSHNKSKNTDETATECHVRQAVRMRRALLRECGGKISCREVLPSVHSA